MNGSGEVDYLHLLIYNVLVPLIPIDIMREVGRALTLLLQSSAAAAGTAFFSPTFLFTSEIDPSCLLRPWEAMIANCVTVSPKHELVAIVSVPMV